MKKVVLAIIISLVGVVGFGELPTSSLVFAQKRNEDKKKDPPGRPVVRDKDKGRDDKPKPAPKKGKKPEDF